MVKWTMLVLLLAGSPAWAQTMPQKTTWASQGGPRPITPVADTQATPVQQVRYQPRSADDTALDQQAIQLIPPGPERVFRLEAESSLQERMRQEAADRGQRIVFPDEPILSKEAYAGRNWPQRLCTAEATYVCYGRLLFEEKNAERYGWDLGAISPLVSTLYFAKDLVLLPYHLAEDPCRRCECSAGYCLPGDPVPYLLYPPNLSLTGAAAEAATIVTLLAVFP